MCLACLAISFSNAIIVLQRFLWTAVEARGIAPSVLFASLFCDQSNMSGVMAAVPSVASVRTAPAQPAVTGVVTHVAAVPSPEPWFHFELTQVRSPMFSDSDQTSKRAEPS